jgi:hypothetical protein
MNIRGVILEGHSNAGKTSLLRALKRYQANDDGAESSVVVLGEHYSQVLQNGRGRRMYTLELWGAAAFPDIDGDGEEDFLVEYPGLHISLPDVMIARVNEGVLELASVAGSLEAAGKSDGTERISETLRKDANPPLIRIEILNWETDEIRQSNYEVVGGNLKQAA